MGPWPVREYSGQGPKLPNGGRTVGLRSGGRAQRFMDQAASSFTTIRPSPSASAADGSLDMGGEFGRTPVAQGTDGRDHNPKGFTMWMAGAGVKAGFKYGATDEYGYYAVENKMHVHDLHATLLHLLGMNHERLTHRYAGRDFRLTDVSGHVHTGILA